LADETEQEALAWVASLAIQGQKSPETAPKRPQGAGLATPGTLSGTDISIYEVLAEGERFELSVRR
jgi:hypothetical protein